MVLYEQLKERVPAMRRSWRTLVARYGEFVRYRPAWTCTLFSGLRRHYCW